jgi:hypothetical protein
MAQHGRDANDGARASTLSYVGYALSNAGEEPAIRIGRPREKGILIRH